MANGYCVLSRRSNDGFYDRVYLGTLRKGRVTAALILPVIRRDRNVPDLIFKNGNNIVALINTGDILRAPFFMQRKHSRWRLVEAFTNGNDGVSSDRVISFGEYQLGTVSTGENGDSYLYVFSPRALKFARLPRGPMVIERLSSNTFSVEYSDNGRRSRRVYSWPFSAKGGWWQLKDQKPDSGVGDKAGQ